MTRIHRMTRLAVLLSISTCIVGAGNAFAVDTPAAAAGGKNDKPMLVTNQPVATQSVAELARMQKYLDQRLDRNAVQKSLINAKGRKVDCVDIHAQPALKNTLLAGHTLEMAPRSAPPAASLLSEKALPPEKLAEPLFEMKNGIATEVLAAGCPQGTVPIPEVTSDDLRRFATLNDFFAKSPQGGKHPEAQIIPPYHNGPTSQHQYAHAYQYVTNWGAQANINIWNMATELNSEFSLGQIWVVGGSGSGLQTLEVGTQKYRDLYGDYNPHLFIYSTRGNYAPGTGCYNNTCGDFVQVSSTYYPGMALGPVSIYNGTQYEANMHWFKDMDGGSWWLNFQGQWIGYYPRNLYSAVINHAEIIDFGGEIIDNRNLNLHTSTDMGSGSFPSAWYQKAAYMRLIRYNYATTTNPNTVWYTAATGLTTSRSDAACYDIAYYNNDANWGSYFFYGGPGYDANNCR